MKHTLIFLSVFTIFGFATSLASQAQADETANSVKAKKLVEDYFTAFGAYDEEAVYALVDGKQEDMLRGSQENMAFKHWVQKHNIKPKNVVVECSYCTEDYCKALAHVSLERHSGTQGDEVIFVLESFDGPERSARIIESYIDKNEARKFHSAPGASCNK